MSRAKLAAAGGALLVFLIATACQHRIVQSGRTMPGDYGFFLFAWRLNACPSPNFLPPHQAADADARIEAGYLDGPYCHGFLKYSLDSGNLSHAGTSPIYLRVDQAAKAGKDVCSLYLAVPVARLCTDVPLSQCPSFQMAVSEGNRLARLALAHSDVALVSETLNATGFADHQTFEDWCAKRIRTKFDSTAHPMFQLEKPVGPELPNVE